MGAFLSEVFNEMAAILLLYAVIGIKLKQSLIVAFGIIVGPSVLNWVSSNDKVDLIAKLSIAILLFLVGLKLDLHIIKNNGPSGSSNGGGGTSSGATTCAPVCVFGQSRSLLIPDDSLD